MATMQKWNSLDPATGAQNYMGADMSDFYVLYAQTRDADCLSRSNFRTIYADISKLGTDNNGESTVRIERFNHWACGYYELILIHESNIAAIRRGNEILSALDRYPVFNEEDFSALQYEEAEKYWTSLSVRERAEIIRDYGHGEVSIFAARRAELPDDPNGLIFDYLTTN